MAYQEVYTVIGQQIEEYKIRDLMQDCTKILHDPAHDGLSYVCTHERVWTPGVPSTPLVIQQDANWNKFRVERLLEPLGLWEPGRFGVWVIVVD